MEDLAAKYGHLRKNKLGGRVFTYIQLMLVITIVFIALNGSTIAVSSKFTYVLQLTTASLLFVVGLISIVRATTRKESAFFASGLAFLLASITLSLGALVFSDAFQHTLPELTDLLPNWYLSLPIQFVMLIGIFRAIFELRDDRLNKTVPLNSKYLLVMVITIYVVIHFVVIRYKDIVPDINTWTQLATIVLGVISVATNILAKRWRTDIYHHWIVISMIFLLGGGMLFLIGGDLTQIQTLLGWLFVLNGIIASLMALLLSILDLLNKGELQKELAVKQAKSLEMFNLATDSVSDLIVISDPEGVVIYANPSVTRITGYTIAEAMGSKAGTLWGRQMSKSFYKEMWDTVKVQKQTYRNEILNRKKNGVQYSAAISISPILDRDGEVIYFVAIERDITAEKNFEQSKYNFLSVISHRLRSPLTTNKWTLEMLESGDAGQLTQEQINRLSDIDVANEKLIKLVNLMSRITDLETGSIELKPSPLSVRDLTEEIVKSYESEIKAKKLQFHIPPESANLPTVTLDKELTKEIINSVVSNAVKFSREGGEVFLRCDYREGMVVLQLEDQGYGIPENEKENVFKSFYRGSNITTVDAEGTGLSLYLARLLIETFGGKIWFESEEGKGSKFYIALPVSANTKVQDESPAEIVAEPVESDETAETISSKAEKQSTPSTEEAVTTVEKA